MLSFSEDKTNPANDGEPEGEKDNIFLTDEVIIEEMAIDGICGVY